MDMTNETRVMKMIASNLDKLPSFAARQRVLTYLLEAERENEIREKGGRNRPIGEMDPRGHGNAYSVS